jgi:glutamyl-tRNA reductase
VLATLFRHALAAGRRVRRETALGRGPASVSQAGVELARQWLGSLEGRSVLLLGSGRVSELAARNLRANGAGELLVVNRTLENARALAERYNASAHSLDELPAALARADIVISATAAPSPIIRRPHVEAALRARLEQSAVGSSSSNRFAKPPQMLLIDLAVPRDVAPDVAEVPGAHLCTVDDLQGIIHDTLARRREVVATADMIVAAEADAFTHWLGSRDALDALTHVREHAEEIRQAEVQRALRNLGNLTADQQYVIDALTRSLVNKVLHTPTMRLKQAAAAGEGDRFATMMEELFSAEF